ncbi:MAG TPA: ABC transporter permease [Candidatus Acidoferrales bacterium]|nr:ABC transporter permease [Candidatus Acidoferrales bacterium]
MEFRSAVQDALGSLGQNRLRSALTMLGIMIGIGAVICTVAIGQGGQTQINEQLQNIGDNLIWIEAGGRNLNGVRTGAYGTNSLMLDDEQAIGRLPLIKACSPHVDSHVQLAYQNQNWWTHYRGVSPAFLQIEHWVVAKGAPFTDQDDRKMAKVCVIGRTIAEQMFPHDDPVGKTIRVGNLPFVVIGVFAPKGVSTYGWDQDDVLMMPYSVAMHEVKGHNWLDDIMCSAVGPGAILPAEDQIGRLLRLQHRLRPDEPDDFNVRHPEEALQALAASNKTFAVMLASIAAVSLLVGGIGIMNIMLVSVTERTREIGVRMAVGATKWDVQQQFLIEAVVLSMIGGGAGVGAGIVVTEALTRALEWPATFSFAAVLVAVAVSIATGIFFGYYPARRAAALHPIDALRYE